MLTPAQIMLIDLLTDRIITIGAMIAKAKKMTDEEAEKEIAYWEPRKQSELDRLKSH